MMQELFVEAQLAAVQAVQLAAAEQARAKHLELLAIRRAQDNVIARILSDMPRAVREASRLGQRRAIVYQFCGGDVLTVTDPSLELSVDHHVGQQQKQQKPSTSTQVSLLYIIKGPRDASARQELVMHGLSPLMERLPHMVAPFGVHFEWQQSGNSNSVVVTF